MNVVLLMNDTLRYDHVGANGNDWIHTPNLDRFAAESAVFDGAYLGSFPTVPCRHEMMKGRYGDPFQKWGPLQWDALTLPEVLRGNGYVTMLINDTPHLINYGYGFDRPFHAWQMIRGNEVDRARTDYFAELKWPGREQHWDDDRIATMYRHTKDRRTEADWFAPQVMQATCDWLERNAGHDNFFLWVDSFDPHEPWDPPQHYVDLYDPGYEGPDIVWPPYCRPEGVYDEAEMKHIRALYAGEVTMVDRWLGRVLDTIDRLGLRENTAVIVMSDHGYFLGEHNQLNKSGPLYHEVSHIVQMVRHPDGIGAGKRIGGFTQPVDFVPSVLDLAGVSVPEEMDIHGDSWLPLMSGARRSLRNMAVSGTYPTYIPPGHLYANALGGSGWTPMAITNRDWFFVDNPEPEKRELFPRATDPGQLHNVADAHPEVVEKLHGQLLTFFRRNRAPGWVIKLYRDGPEGIEPPATAMFDEQAFPRGLPFSTPLGGNVV